MLRAMLGLLRPVGRMELRLFPRKLFLLALRLHLAVVERLELLNEGAIEI